MKNLIILHESKDAARDGANDLLRFAVSNEPVASLVFEGLKSSVLSDNNDEVVCVIPDKWGIEHSAAGLRTVSYTEDVPICREIMQKNGQDPWLAISNGRFAAQINGTLLKTLLSKVEADVVAITAKPELLAYREKVRFMAQGKVAGFRRLYVDCAEPQPVLIDCPHHIFIRTTMLDHLLSDLTIAQFFTTFQKLQYSNTVRCAAFGIAGHAWDLETEEGVLGYCRTSLNSSRAACLNENVIRNRNFSEMGTGNHESSVLCGKVLAGKNIKIGANVIVIGPVIIGDNVTIEQGAVVNSSIIGPNCSIRQGQVISNRIVKASDCDVKELIPAADDTIKRMQYKRTDFFGQRAGRMPFRSWHRFSYAGCFKRIFDIIVSSIVIIMCAPIFPIIIFAIKLTSRGPVIFKDGRQGLHGRPFKCYKFRSMRVGADKMQNRLRILNDADGPQFKMTDDPRLSPVGGFLREMYLDELLQFFNVLFGQMSIVGPRPSPESENTFCPFWRDARLSVRPGITGLWQVYRTREPMRDFQEWIYYDVRYVKTLSLKLDVWICWQTAMRMVRNFVKQF